MPKPAELTHGIPPPPFGPSAVSLAAAAQPAPVLQSPFPAIAQSSILTPKTNRDVLAWLLVLLALPQSVSCLVLMGYIVLGSFRAFAGSTISKYLGDSDASVEYELEAKPTVRYNYYRSELMGDVLQLFSINSFILLVCHYTLPSSWIQCLIVLAKSIIASHLVGSYTTGSTTYVSVVSASGASSTTTTTTYPGALNLVQGGILALRTDARYYASSMLNSLLGFACVLAINYIMRHWLLVLNLPLVLNDFSKFNRKLANTTGDQNGHPFSYSSIVLSMFAQSLYFLSPRSSASGKSGRFMLDEHVFLGRNTIVSDLVIHICMNYLNLGETSIKTISVLLRETNVVINYAYLVLCIHVISLTISPFLLRIFILKDYSKTLDHLSALTPDVPYSPFKKHGIVPNVSRESTTTDSAVVINLEQAQLQHQMALKGHPEPLEFKIDPAIANSDFSFLFASHSVSANNFKIFCMVPSTNKSTFSGNKTNHNRTIIDRKRSNSSVTPSTTIMDKYFTISIQPIWSWLAAIKVLLLSPKLFSGHPTTHKSNGQKFTNKSCRNSLPFAIASIEESRVVFEVLDQDQFEKVLLDGFSVSVNTVYWPHVKLLVDETSRKVYLCIYGLTPLYQYEIELSSQGYIVSNHLVNTTSTGKPSQISCSLEASPLQTLQSSLKHTIESLNSLKTTFKKIKKDEHKRVTDLKKQIESLKAKIDKYGNREAKEGRVSGKLKGLQYSVTQLENEIDEMQQQVKELDLTNDVVQNNYKKEEESYNKQIAELDAAIRENEREGARIKSEVKLVQNEKNLIETKKKKIAAKLDGWEDELNQLNLELKSMKKAMLSKLQRRQRRAKERFDTILPKIADAIEEMKEEFDSIDPEATLGPHLVSVHD